jgi:tRNA A58 N-methylase Trm61
VRRGSRPVRPGSSALADRSGPFDQRGDTVLDVAAAPGCLSMLQRKVGPTGTIVGIDASEQMLQLAAARVAEHGWGNVRLITAPVATAPIHGVADAALFTVNCTIRGPMTCPTLPDAALGSVATDGTPAR